MSSVTKLQLQIEYMSRGIVPLSGIGGVQPWEDINRVFAEMSPAESRKMKRKFRKQWRRLVQGKEGKRGRKLAMETGFGKKTPQKIHKLTRKNIVRYAVERSILTRQSVVDW